MSANDPKRTSRFCEAALNLEDGSEALEVVAGSHAAWPPRPRYPLPATVIAADPPRSAADEEDSAVPVHEPAVAVAVDRPATPRDCAAAANGARTHAAAGPASGAHVATGPSATHVA